VNGGMMNGISFTPCLNAATLDGTGFEDFLRTAAVAGFPAVEVPVQQVTAYGPGWVRDLLDGLELAAAAASGILPAGPVLPHPVLVSAATWEAALDGLDERLAAMVAIGCPVATIVLNPRCQGDPGEARATATARIQHLARSCASRGITLAVEAVGVRAGLPPDLDGPQRVAATLPELRDLLDRASAPPGAVAACVDSFHWAAAGADPRHLDGIQVAHLQVADAPPGVPAGQWTDAMRLHPGDGTLNWATLGEALAAAGYHGTASVELFNPHLRAQPDAEVARRALAAAATCWQHGGQR
jgi:sugar phosphate isomerase/epimerase